MNTRNRNICRLGCCPAKQDLRSPLSNHGRVEKLATEKSTCTKSKRIPMITEKRKIENDRLAVGTLKNQTLWAAGKLKLLRD